MRAGVLILLVVLVAATAFGLWRRVTDGRMRAVARTAAPIPAGDDDPEVDVEVATQGRVTEEGLGAALGREATLVQFSTAFCQPCRATRRILDEIATMVDGVAHVEIDAESHLDLVRQYDIRRTPTVLVVDRDGVIRRRAAGLPRKADVIAALGEVIGPAKGSQEQ